MQEARNGLQQIINKTTFSEDVTREAHWLDAIGPLMVILCISKPHLKRPK